MEKNKTTNINNNRQVARNIYTFIIQTLNIVPKW